ncbi:MAG: family 43 glycosylhydrolase [Prevotella sp.]|nr:family 43 glycosylhydrolase [Prevotella sp.]
MKKTALFYLASFLALPTTAQDGIIRPGELWLDTDGKHINAHGGGILLHEGTYYWFGEHKAERTSNAMVGITCYSSTDLTTWKNMGVALPVSQEKGNELERGCIMERPKVIYNPATRKFVMWFHLELRHRGYDAARFGVAVSDRPEGPYQYLYSGRANAGKWPVEFGKTQIEEAESFNLSDYQEWWTPRWTRAVRRGLFIKRDFAEGQMSRDMTLYVDDDGKAYHIFSSEENLTIHIAELTPDFLHHSGRYTRLSPAGHNEAPAIFKHQDTYWMITSGCTGWDPNEARMFSAPSIWGPWKQHPNPCVGPNSEITFGGQSTFILPLPDGKFIFMADIWRPRHPIDARYIWLPITFDNETPVIKWQDEWKL